MQAVSLEEELKLIDGVPYDIDFFQDFASVYVGERTFTELTVSDLTELVQDLREEVADYCPTVEDYQREMQVWEALENMEKHDRKLAKKWKNRPKPKTIEEAEANFDRILDELLRR